MDNPIPTPLAPGVAHPKRPYTPPALMLLLQAANIQGHPGCGFDSAAERGGSVT